MEHISLASRLERAPFAGLERRTAEAGRLSEIKKSRYTQWVMIYTNTSNYPESPVLTHFTPGRNESLELLGYLDHEYNARVSELLVGAHTASAKTSPRN